MWDVRALAEGRGSLASRIKTSTVKTNDFAGYVAAHPGIAAIASTALRPRSFLERRCLPTLSSHSLLTSSPADKAQSLSSVPSVGDSGRRVVTERALSDRRPIRRVTTSCIVRGEAGVRNRSSTLPAP